jgi:hypothetical protein
MKSIISIETAMRIYNAHREIEAANNLQKEIDEANKWSTAREKGEPVHKDAFGRKRHLTLGIPAGNDSHRLLRVPPAMTPYIIKAHIAEQRKELEQACLLAEMELNGDVPVEELKAAE